MLGCLCRSLSLYICGLGLDRSQVKPCLVMSRLIKYLWAFFQICNRQTKVLHSFVSLAYSGSIFRYIHTSKDCKKILHVFLNKNVISVNLIKVAMLEFTKAVLSAGFLHLFSLMQILRILAVLTRDSKPIIAKESTV